MVEAEERRRMAENAGGRTTEDGGPKAFVRQAQGRLLTQRLDGCISFNSNSTARGRRKRTGRRGISNWVTTAGSGWGDRGDNTCRGGKSCHELQECYP
jgi:hypothetical protein